MKNKYEEMEEELNRIRCSECDGTGTVDDADFGDISFNEYECEKCKGTGIYDAENGKIKCKWHHLVPQKTGWGQILYYKCEHCNHVQGSIG